MCETDDAPGAVLSERERFRTGTTAKPASGASRSEYGAHALTVDAALGNRRDNPVRVALTLHHQTDGALESAHAAPFPAFLGRRVCKALRRACQPPHATRAAVHISALSSDHASTTAHRSGAASQAWTVPRKKQRTREHLSRVAMELFAERSLQTVTIEEICERAEVSPRTFFRYFPSKDDVVFTNHATRHAIVRDALARELPDEALSAAIRRAVQVLLDHDLQEDRDSARLRARVVANEPAFTRHLTALTTKWTDELNDVVAHRLGNDD
jgi:AcrR family transcriptional regulator